MSDLPRRAFLIKATCLLGVSAVGPRLSFAQEADLEKAFAQIRSNLLQLVNEERAVEQVGPLMMDDSASRLATAHARDMAEKDFASHWGSDGLKPYMRYSFAGHHDATQENVSAADNTWSMKPADLVQDTAYLHVRLYQEKPPNDGHRRAILATQQTHVGFGLAVDHLRLRMVELFVAKYVELKPMNQNARVGQTLTVAGRLLNPKHFLQEIEVFYEPLPTIPELDWLRQPRPYSFPSESKAMLPKIPPPLRYASGAKGIIDTSPDGHFSAPVKLFKDEPGIYTIVCWVRRVPADKAFPATEFCIRAT